MAELCRGNHLPEVEVSSAATTREEIGNDIYPPMKKALRESGYRCPPHAARQTVPGDYDRYDYLIGMDHENLSDMKGIYGGDPLKKISLLRMGSTEESFPMLHLLGRSLRESSGALTEKESG